jgi:hypothetical protein
MSARRIVPAAIVALMTCGCFSPASPLAIPAALKITFDRYDLDRDGNLDLTEFVEGRYGELRFVKAPTDAEIASFKVGFAKQFDQLDTDRDLRLSPAEFAKIGG